MTLLDELFGATVVVLFLWQVIFPLVTGKPTFPMFRNPKKRKTK